MMNNQGLLYDNKNEKFITMLHCILLFAFSLILFLAMNFHCEFIKMEARWALFVKYMLRDGISFYPVLNNKPYADYPGLFTALSYLVALATKQVNMFTITFPTSIAAALTVVFTYLIGLLHSRKIALYSSMLLIGTGGFFESARTANPDMMVMCITAGLFYLAYRSVVKKTGSRWIMMFAGFIAGFFFRGPIGLIIPASVVCVTFLLNKNIGKFFFYGIASVILLTACESLNLYAALLQGGMPFVRESMHMQFYGRLGSLKPFYYYFLNSFGVFALSYPVAILTLIFLWDKFFKKHDRNSEFFILKFLLAWFLLIFVGLSIPGSKHPRYVLAALPALSIISAFFFCTDYIRYKIHKVIILVLNLILLVSPLILLLSVVFCSVIKSVADPYLNFPIRIPGLYLLIFSMLIYPVIYFCKLDRDQFIRFFIGVVSLFITYTTFMQPLVLQVEDSSKFTRQVEMHRNNSDPVVFYKIGPDGDELKYVVNAKNLFIPIVTKNLNELVKYTSPCIIVMETSDFKEIPMDIRDNLDIVANGKLGHSPCIALRIK